MQALDPIEVALARLMPPALSEDSQFRLDAMIDELAGPESEKVVEFSAAKWWGRWIAGGGIAAAIGAMCAVFPTNQHLAEPKLAQSSVQEMSSGLVVVSESNRIESMTDEGLQENADGVAMRAVRLKAVEENNVLDKESGLMIKISEPREEVLLVPIGSF